MLCSCDLISILCILHSFYGLNFTRSRIQLNIHTRTKNKNKRLRFCNKPLTIACFLELYAAVKSFSLRVPEAFTAFVILQQLNKSDMTKRATKFQPTSHLRSMQPLSHPAYIRLYNRGTLGNIVGFRTAKSSINFRLSCKKEEISINGLLERKKYTVLKNC